MRLAFLFPLLASVAHAQAPELVTDRPDFTESGLVVPLGRIQIEGGLTWAHGGDANVVSGPELLARYTPFPRTELRLGAPDYVGAGTDASGFSDASVGAKVQLGPVGAWDLAIIAATTLPIGEDGVGSGTFDPEVLLTTGRALAPGVDLGAQVSGARSDDAFLFGATLVGGASLSERLGAFLELALEAPEAGGAGLLLHHGYTFALAPAVQVDAHAAVGLTDAAPDVLLGAGLSVRQ
jgi:hypothetical protein